MVPIVTAPLLRTLCGTVLSVCDMHHYCACALYVALFYQCVTCTITAHAHSMWHCSINVRHAPLLRMRTVCGTVLSECDMPSSVNLPSRVAYLQCVIYCQGIQCKPLLYGWFFTEDLQPPNGIQDKYL